MNKDMIVLENLTKSYGAKKAVDGISFSVKEGEMLALLGVNGAGKSTTIKMLSCLTKPSGGKASIGGYDIITHVIMITIEYKTLKKDIKDINTSLS